MDMAYILSWDRCMGQVIAIKMDDEQGAINIACFKILEPHPLHSNTLELDKDGEFSAKVRGLRFQKQ